MFFGPHRKPSGVILSYEHYVKLLDAIDDMVVAFEVRRRDRKDTGERLTFEDLVHSQGFTVDEVPDVSDPDEGD